MSKRSRNQSASQEEKETHKLKLFGIIAVEGPRDFVILVVGVLAFAALGIVIGVGFCYFYLSKQPSWIDPLIANAVKATVAAQPTVTLMPTCTLYPSSTPTSPTLTPAPAPTSTNTLTPTPTPTSTNTLTPTPTPTSTNTLTPTPTPTSTNTLTPTPTPTSTNTLAPAPTPTVENKIFSIEGIPFKVFAYGGDNDPKVGKGSGFLTVVRNGISGTEYYLDYFLPDEGDGYAGLALRFLDPQDWTAYEFVEVTIGFEDEQASCDFGVRDMAGEIGYVRLGNSSHPSDIALTVSGGQQTAKIPLATNFKSVNRKVIYELIFNADSYFIRGRHTFKVSSIKLLKP